MRVNLTIHCENNAARPDPTERRLLRQAARLTLVNAAFDRDAELSLVFTDDPGIQALNREYRGQDRSTDVLSFPLLEGEDVLTLPPGIAAPLGDIVISRQHAAAQALALEHSPLRETVFLFIHGLLHLLGFDHEQGQAEEKEMFRRQDEIIAQLDFQEK